MKPILNKIRNPRRTLVARLLLPSRSYGPDAADLCHSGLRNAPQGLTWGRCRRQPLGLVANLRPRTEHFEVPLSREIRVQQRPLQHLQNRGRRGSMCQKARGGGGGNKMAKWGMAGAAFAVGACAGVAPEPPPQFGPHRLLPQKPGPF